MAEVPSGSVSVLAESDKCKHVDIVDVREGETLDKESINQTAKNWDDASDNVFEEHIREEALTVEYSTTMVHGQTQAAAAADAM